MAKTSYRAARDDADQAAFLDITARAFALPRANLEGWLARLGLENLRLYEEQGTPRAALAVLPMGQHFGGRSVPTGGLVAVGVEPEARGSGTGRALVEAVLRELAERRVALSTLYPSTVGFYRGAGYEIAGARFEWRLPAAALGARRAALSTRRGTPDDEPAVRKLYAGVAARSPGLLERHEYIWGRVREWREERREMYLFERGRELEGYVFLAPRRKESGRHDLFLSDFAFQSGAAAESLLALLAGDRSMTEDVLWYGRLDEPLLLHLGEPVEPHARAKLASPWMVRIVDAPRALEARGWPARAKASLGIELDDELLPSNCGRFQLELEGGRARVEPGERGDLRLDVQALAALYTGFLSASTLAAAGRLAGEADAIALADELFAGPAPALGDMF